jgi:undecaprenyl-diphosphatase
VATQDRAVEDRAVEVLGGTPQDVRRPPVTPAVRLVPPYVADRIRRFDEVGDAFFERFRGNPVADRVMYGASALGDFSLLWHLVGVARAVADPRAERESVRLAAALAVESVLINGVVKSGFRRSRPERVEHAIRRLRRPRSSSFPSGHATSGFMAASLLTAGRPRQRLLWYGLAAVVASSRVHVRIHHPTDVAAGAVVGLVLGRVARRFGA